MVRVTNANPRRATVIADPGIATRIPRAKAMRVAVVASPVSENPNALLGSPSPIQIIEETDEAFALDNEPVKIYIDDTAVAANIIPNAEPTRVFVSSGALIANDWDDPEVLVVARYGLTASWTYPEVGRLRGLVTGGASKYVALETAGLSDADLIAGTPGTVVQAILEIENFFTDTDGTGSIAGETVDSTDLITGNGTYVGEVVLDGGTLSSIYIRVGKGSGVNTTFDVVGIELKNIT